MASDAAAVATEAPSPAHSVVVTAPLAGTFTPQQQQETARLLKRPREDTPPSPNSLASHDLNPLGSPTKSARLALAVGPLPTPLTGAAALEDERYQREAEDAAPSPPAGSDHPSHRVLASLLSGATEAMSRPADTPQSVPTASMEPGSPRQNNNAPMMAAEAADRADEEGGDASPQSPNGISGAPVTTSPTPMDMDNKTDSGLGHRVAGQEERSQPNSLSYPGSLQASGHLAEPSPRGMSYPMPVHGQTSPTSASKKHKCPYCDIEFTRHHNLKSHLLTHSQEKPYVCTECPLRFRRLHDLKRHGKLHTGEKPHICPKCDRKFARGDALARHTKGAGGCAGRRSSMGSFVDGDDLENHTLGDGDDSTMSGLAYDTGDDELRRQSMPTSASSGPQGVGDAYGAAHSRTYPPAIPRSTGSGNGGGLYPPSVSQPQGAGSSSVPNSMTSSQAATNTSVSSAPLSGGNPGGMYSQTGMTESPKALSPGIPTTGHQDSNHQRSPGISQHMHQQQPQPQPQKGDRRESTSLPGGGGQSTTKSASGLSNPGGFTAAPAFGGAPAGGNASSASSDSRNMFAQSDPSVWAYIQALEDKVKTLSDKVEYLDQEVATLRGGQQQRDSEMLQNS
ncbi:ZnF C2H2 [Geosmithia morbida]|uniref:ZnF C2H2 n=1 Tax=Geosmithia morbida TaxID=1094350 RepID=A0A9P4YWZ4_9HYPO|nr:ZnF C2H2 [Geosmithia morbida]KAF4123337.1 ZnF C2H2 [Geosmithia morbida]